MALQASGQISLLDIIAEFGGGTSLNDFYKGGTWVPNTAANASVPTSGQITITDFYGASAASLSASPNPCSGNASGFGISGFVQTTSCAVSGHSGGVSWSYVSGATGHNISNTTGTTVSWSGTSAGTTTSVWRVTNGGNTYDVTVKLIWTNLN